GGEAREEPGAERGRDVAGQRVLEERHQLAVDDAEAELGAEAQGGAGEADGVSGGARRRGGLATDGPRPLALPDADQRLGEEELEADASRRIERQESERTLGERDGSVGGQRAECAGGGAQGEVGGPRRVAARPRGEEVAGDDLVGGEAGGGGRE